MAEPAIQCLHPFMGQKIRERMKVKRKSSDTDFEKCADKAVSVALDVKKPTVIRDPSIKEGSTEPFARSYELWNHPGVVKRESIG